MTRYLKYDPMYDRITVFFTYVLICQVLICPLIDRPNHQKHLDLVMPPKAADLNFMSCVPLR